MEGCSDRDDLKDVVAEPGPALAEGALVNGSAARGTLLEVRDL